MTDTVHTAICDGCRTPFVYTRTRGHWWTTRRYCSRACVVRWGRWAERQNRQFKLCFGCGRCFVPPVKHPEQGACSRSCAAKLRNAGRGKRRVA